MKLMCLTVLALFAAKLIVMAAAEENITEAEINANITDEGFVESDIKLPKEMQYELERALRSKSLDRNRLPQALVADHSYYKWPNATVNYVFDKSVTNDKKTIDAIWAAIYELQNKTCIRFRLRTNQADFVNFTKGRGCWSYIGRIGGQQHISIGRGCESKGIVIHEILHALGRWHEQSRPDRDTYITINAGNIISGTESNFEKVQTSSIITLQGIAYDLGSIMHYRAYAFSKNGQPTITPKDSSISLNSLGQRNGLSEKDIRHVKTHYKCQNQPQASWGTWSTWSSCSRTCNGGTRTRTRSCMNGDNCPGDSSQSETCNANSCPAPPSWSSWNSWSRCTQTCGGGRQSRTRTCQNGNTCSGSTIEYRDCNTNSCPQPPSWTSWSSWSDCSQTCVGGRRSRTRRCENGDTCSGENIQFEECNKNVSCTPSPSSGEWGSWSTCSATCGSGTRIRSRQCNLADKSKCQTVTESCNTKACPSPLRGLKHLGCYYVPTSSVSLRLLENETPDLRDDPFSRSKPVEKCGLGALQFHYSTFSVMLGFCISGSNRSTDYQTFLGTFCKSGKGGNFINVLYMDVYEIEDRQQYAIAANEVVHSTTISFPTATSLPPSKPVGDEEGINSGYQFIPSFVLLIVGALISLAFLL